MDADEWGAMDDRVVAVVQAAAPAVRRSTLSRNCEHLQKGVI